MSTSLVLFTAMAPKGKAKAPPAVKKQREPTKKRQRPSRMVTKQIGGDKNGGERTVRVSRLVSEVSRSYLNPTTRIYCTMTNVCNFS